MSIDGYEDVPVTNEAALMKAVSAQPVSVAICASEAMQFYSSGVIAGEGSCTGLNHGVLASGYAKAGLPQMQHCAGDEGHIVPAKLPQGQCLPWFWSSACAHPAQAPALCWAMKPLGTKWPSIPEHDMKLPDKCRMSKASHTGW